MSTLDEFAQEIRSRIDKKREEAWYEAAYLLTHSDDPDVIDQDAIDAAKTKIIDMLALRYIGSQRRPRLRLLAPTRTVSKTNIGRLIKALKKLDRDAAFRLNSLLGDQDAVEKFEEACNTAYKTSPPGGRFPDVLRDRVYAGCLDLIEHHPKFSDDQTLYFCACVWCVATGEPHNRKDNHEVGKAALDRVQKSVERHLHVPTPGDWTGKSPAPPE